MNSTNHTTNDGIQGFFSVSTNDRESAARCGTLNLPHGTIETPVFMPVGTQSSVKGLLHRDVSDIGFSLILSNTYHLFLRPGIEVIRRFGGLHSFCAWDGNILTDSGGYQVFSLAAFRKISDDGVTFRSHIDGQTFHLTPETVFAIQRDLGSDVQMALDVCTAPDVSRKEAESACRITTAWARRAAESWRADRESGTSSYRGALFGIVQGNFHEDLRTRSAEDICELDLPGIAIGGLSVGESPEQFEHFLKFTTQKLPSHTPRYVMGIGTPDYIFAAVEAGIDMFDCVFPTRTARTGAAMVPDGRLVLTHAKHADSTIPIEDGCPCIACRRYSRAYIRHLLKAGEMLGPILLTFHNLTFMARLLESIRASIRAGRFLSFKREFLHRYLAGHRR